MWQTLRKSLTASLASPAEPPTPRMKRRPRRARASARPAAMASMARGSIASMINFVSARYCSLRVAIGPVGELRRRVEQEREDEGEEACDDEEQPGDRHVA